MITFPKSVKLTSLADADGGKKKGKMRDPDPPYHYIGLLSEQCVVRR